MYSIKNQQVHYITHSNDLFIGNEGTSIAFLFDENGAVLKHGEVSQVDAYRALITRKYKDAGFDELLENLEVTVIRAIPQTLAIINHCISSTGYIKSISAKLKSGNFSIEDASKQIAV
jgi:hypothetical protein